MCKYKIDAHGMTFRNFNPELYYCSQQSGKLTFNNLSEEIYVNYKTFEYKY